MIPHVSAELSENYPDFIGYSYSDGKFKFYYGVREKEYLDRTYIPYDAGDTIEHDGKTYIYVGWEASYIWYGDISSTVMEYEFVINEQGVAIISESFSEIPMGLLLIPGPDGDANGDTKVNAKDVIAVMKHLVGVKTDVFNDYAADMRYDNVLNARDVLAIMKAIVNG